ncbi:hypothetical protein ACN38_g13024 [Penicillium nordicum]|uniref:Uncharacterized protein n=1 Tax=Penicillium nordicum TaxID=229535 RepID=A0A0M8NXK8_9EURO|nr:hypothetical protein ACN38_g13024 [Penicillium nordicum]
MPRVYLLQPAPGIVSYTLGQKTTISEYFAQIDQAPIYMVHDMTLPLPDLVNVFPNTREGMWFVMVLVPEYT